MRPIRRRFFLCFSYAIKSFFVCVDNKNRDLIRKIDTENGIKV